MKDSQSASLLMIAGLIAAAASGVLAQDWPQWRGANRDARASGFTAPETWPQELTQKWKVVVGRGDASPALVGGKLYLFVRDAANEITLCLDAATGKELWRDQYLAQAATEPMGQHPGPRSSPTVAEGKVLVYGVRGTLSCLDAATGKVLWRKNEFDDAVPRFFTSSSPLATDGLCIAQLGGDNKGGIVAFELASGNEKWKWTGDGTAYASPTLMTVGGVKTVVALTAAKVVGLAVADGKLLWETPFAVKGRAYNAATPIVDGTVVIYTGGGRGARAVKIEKNGDSFAAKELWSTPDNGVQFNTPVLRDGRLYGIAQDGTLFCLSAQDGKALWTTSLAGAGRGFGSVVDVGRALLALSPAGELTVFEPSDKEFKKLGSYKVGADTYAYPIPAGKGIYIKDKDSMAFWTF